MRQQTEADKLATELENSDNDVVRAVSTWDSSDIAALVESGGDIGPVTRLGDVVNVNDFDAANYVLVGVDLQ